MSNGTYGAFNARLLTPIQIARKFVPLPQFQNLVHSSHSVLLGPRGCGKTTLFKMLSRPALETWKTERRSQYKKYNPFEYPEFEAIYIPSDSRWSYELLEIENVPKLDKKYATRIQRVMVSISVLTAIIDTLMYIKEIDNELEINICSSIIKICKLKNCLPRFSRVKLSLNFIVTELRGTLNMGNIDILDDYFSKLSVSFLAHTMDTPGDLLDEISFIIKNKITIQKWALCFDELEIAPEWLRTELFDSLRSVKQNCILKLTYYPVIPKEYISIAEPGDDWQPIRLWYSHITDSRSFCDNLTTDFLQKYFKNENQKINPSIFFSSSDLIDEEIKEMNPKSYERGSTFYNCMNELQKTDHSFYNLLKKKKLSPEDPYTESTEFRAQFFRKIKQTVIMRKEFMKGEKFRSRKITDVYSGKESIYAISEANPRWLLRLLTDFVNRWKSDPKVNKNNHPIISKTIQATVLNNHSRRFQAKLGATPTPSSDLIKLYNIHNLTLFEFLDVIGKKIQGEFYKKEFPLEPVGSFYVDPTIAKPFISVIRKAINIGALVYIGKADEETPYEIRKSRFRLSFMLAPLYKIPLRTLRSISLRNLLWKEDENDTPNLFNKKKLK